jgi:hypothetical protein
MDIVRGGNQWTAKSLTPARASYSMHHKEGAGARREPDASTVLSG